MPFKKGQSGNPAGRKKGSGHKQRLAQIIKEHGWDDKRIIEMFETFIEKGNYMAFKDFTQYIWGRPPQEVLLGNSDDDGLKIQIEFVDPPSYEG